RFSSGEVDRAQVQHSVADPQRIVIREVLVAGRAPGDVPGPRADPDVVLDDRGDTEGRGGDQTEGDEPPGPAEPGPDQQSERDGDQRGGEVSRWGDRDGVREIERRDHTEDEEDHREGQRPEPGPLLRRAWWWRRRRRERRRLRWAVGVRAVGRERRTV